MNNLLILTPDVDQYAETLATRNLPQLEITQAATVTEAQPYIGQANIILGNPALVADLLPQAQRLAWVQSTFAGVEALCSPQQRHDYRLTGVKHIFGPLMSEYVFGSMLAIERQMVKQHQHQLNKQWVNLPYRSLHGLTIGICGLGSIGRHIARTAAHFGLRVFGLKRSVESVPHVETVYPLTGLLEFVRQLDYLVITLPSTPDTRRLIDLTVLQAMPPSATLINVGRGDVVVERDLITALQHGVIKAAVLDVFEQEPLPQDSPLWEMDNVFITPHNAAFSFPEAIVDIFCQNYECFRQKRPLNYLVDFAKGY